MSGRDHRATTVGTRWLLLSVLTTLLLNGCGLYFLRSVDDAVVNSVEGDGVQIVSRDDYPNPSDEWLYTYLLLEISGEDHLAVVAEVLTANGWQIREYDPSFTLVLGAEKLPEADMVMLELTDFLAGGVFIRPERQFSEVPLDVGRSYLVAILTPLR